MPAVNWDGIPDEPVRPGVHRRGFGTNDVMLVRNDCQPGVAVRPHIHAFDQIAMISKGGAISRIGDEHNQVGPGSIMLIPAGVEHSIEPLGSEVVENIDIFAAAPDDYLHLLRSMR